MLSSTTLGLYHQASGSSNGSQTPVRIALGRLRVARGSATCRAAPVVSSTGTRNHMADHSDSHPGGLWRRRSHDDPSHLHLRRNGPDRPDSPGDSILAGTQGRRVARPTGGLLDRRRGLDSGGNRLASGYSLRPWRRAAVIPRRPVPRSRRSRHTGAHGPVLWADSPAPSAKRPTPAISRSRPGASWNPLGRLGLLGRFLEHRGCLS